MATTLSLALSPAQLERMITVEPVRDTQLIELKANDTDPVRATRILNTLVTEFVRENTILQGQRFLASKESLNNQMVNLDSRINALT